MTHVVPLFLLIACQDYELKGLKAEEGAQPIIEVSPSELVFGTLPEGESDSQVFSITNVGGVTLKVTEIEISMGDDAFTLVNDGAMGKYEPGETQDVTVTWTSSGEDDDIGQAVVVSDDIGSPETFVDLIGGADVPDLVIEPGEVDFGAVPVGDTRNETVILRNAGAAPLTIASLETTESVFAYDFDLELPYVLEPEEAVEATVSFTPEGSETYNGRLEVESDDPGGIEFANLTGQAGSQPIAECEADPATVEAIHESTTWKGNDSYDPAGYRITEYNWRLVTTPSGSAARMPTGSGANRTGFTPDVVGTYEAELVVVNELGDRSEPCIASLEAIPGGDLWIEIYWDHSGDDMDLHLLAPGGRLETDTDCYFANCVGSGLDWGTRGDRSDNPSLDIDDIPGTGPENINISDPQSGTFTVYVNDYPGSSYPSANAVTMNIYIGGLLEWSDTRTITGEDIDEAFAEIEWPSGTVSSL